MNYFKFFSILCLIFFISSFSFAQCDFTSLDSVYSIIKQQKIDQLPIGKRVSEIGKLFLGKPYEAFMLEGENEELRYRFDKFDCVIFDEISISLALVKSETNLKNQFENQLVKLRYRNNEISYINRNHYFSDWIKQAEKNKILEILKPAGIAVQSDKVINFMTAHPKSYSKLSDSTIFLVIQKHEKELTQEKFWYLPSNKIEKWITLLNEGDIITFVTKIEGLDVAHVGMVTFLNGEPHLLNAPRPGVSVRINEDNLTQTMIKNPGYIGVIVGRLLPN